jgi:hypothetical protein
VLQVLRYRNRNVSSGQRIQIDEYFGLGESQDEAETKIFQDKINRKMRGERGWVMLLGDEGAI